MSLSVSRVAKPGRLLGRRGTIGRPVPEPQDITFRALCRTFGLASVGFGTAAGQATQATAAQSSGSKLPRHGAMLGLRIGFYPYQQPCGLVSSYFITMAEQVPRFLHYDLL